MGFFNIEHPANADGTPYGYKAAKQAIDAVDLATMRKDRPRNNLAAIRVDLDAGTLTGTDGHILLKLELGAKALKEYVLPALEYLAHGQPCPVDSGCAYWTSEAAAKSCGCRPGWQEECVYPAVDRVIPASFEHGPGSDSVRPFFSFALLARVANIYKALGVEDSGFYNYSFNGLVNWVVDRRQVRVFAGAVALEPEMTLLVMPITNPNMG